MAKTGIKTAAGLTTEGGRDFYPGDVPIKLLAAMEAEKPKINDWLY
jgi:hypothetical protein